MKERWKKWLSLHRRMYQFPLLVVLHTIGKYWEGDGLPVAVPWLTAFVLLGAEVYFVRSYLQNGNIFWGDPARLLMALMALFYPGDRTYMLILPVCLLLLAQLAEVVFLVVIRLKEEKPEHLVLQGAISLFCLANGAANYICAWLVVTRFT